MLRTTVFVSFCVVICLAFRTNAGLADQKQPNIILVMADDQGYGDAGYTGHPILKTPNMDAMSRNSVVFNRFYAASPVCSPTRASVMTGRNPIRVNVPDHGHYLRPHETTIAEALKSAGYVTGHFGKWHIGSVQSESPTCPGQSGFDEWLSGLNFFDIDPYLSRNGQFEQMHGSGSVVTMDATLEFLKRHSDTQQPIFATVWFPAPHSPHRESISHDEGIRPVYNGKKNRGYFDEISLIDQQLGRLRTLLRELKIEDDTIVWYCSDNGGLLKESSGGRAKKGSIYEGGLRVPCMIEWPKRFERQEINVPACSSDIYPTLLALANAKVENQLPLDGIDLAKIISGQQTERPPIGFWRGVLGGQSTHSDKIIKELMLAQKSGRPSPYPKRLLKNVQAFPDRSKGISKGHAAWNDWPWKLHRIAGPQGIKIELYHLESDPMETDNLSKREPERAASMTAQLEAWQKSVLESWSGLDYGSK